MDKSALLTLADSLLSESKTAILSTVSSEGPKMRWMSPIFLKNDPEHIYAITSNSFNKTNDISSNENVQWMLQNKSLDTIITFNGSIKSVENLSLRTEVLETVGQQLQTFWKINNDPSSLTVLDTDIESAVVFFPVKGKKYLVSFK